jgi:hypothetical protein
MVLSAFEDKSVAVYMREKQRHAELFLQLVAVKENGTDREPQHRLVDERWPDCPLRELVSRQSLRSHPRFQALLER